LISVIINCLYMDQFSGLSNCAFLYNMPKQHGRGMRLIFSDALR